MTMKLPPYQEEMLAALRERALKLDAVTREGNRRGKSILRQALKAAAWDSLRDKVEKGTIYIIDDPAARETVTSCIDDPRMWQNKTHSEIVEDLAEGLRMFQGIDCASPPLPPGPRWNSPAEAVHQFMLNGPRKEGE